MCVCARARECMPKIPYVRFELKIIALLVLVCGIDYLPDICNGLTLNQKKIIMSDRIACARALIGKTVT